MKVITAIHYAFENKQARAKTLLYAVGLFLILGIPTALLPNLVIPYYRMVQATWLDYVFLLTTSLLIAVYLAIPENKVCKPYGAFSGGFLGFLAFGCPICNKLLVLLLGFDFMYGMVNPIRPILGIVSVIVLGYAIENKWAAK